MQVVGNGHGFQNVGRGSITLDANTLTLRNAHGTVVYRLSDVMQASIVEGGFWGGGSYIQILLSGQAGAPNYDVAIKLPNVVVFKKEQLPQFKALAAEIRKRRG